MRSTTVTGRGEEDQEQLGITAIWGTVPTEGYWNGDEGEKPSRSEVS